MGPQGQAGGFGLQHTDFARRCQHFAAISAGLLAAGTVLIRRLYRLA